MNKTTSFLWGVLSSLAGGILVAILLYYLYLKKKKVKVAYFVLGLSASTILLSLIVGAFLLFGLIQMEINSFGFRGG